MQINSKIELLIGHYVYLITMLIEFSVENFLSFKEPVTLSLVKGIGNELAGTNSIDHNVPSTPSLLRSAAIFGPNASGKSNLIKAMQFMRHLVLKSASETQSGDSLFVTPFLLDEHSASEPSVFEMNFVDDNVRYQYGFAATREQIKEEWLLAYPKGRPQRWIDRRFDNESEEYVWGNTDKLSGKKHLWQEATRSNALFLSTAIQLNNQQLLPVFNWFLEKIHVLGVGYGDPNFSIELCEQEETKYKVMELLRAADVGIDDIELEKEEFDVGILPKETPESLKRQIEKDFKNESFVNVKTTHVNEHNNKVIFDLDDESDGTRKIFALSGPWLNSLGNDCVLVVDELHEHLHPLISKFLIKLFHSKKSGNAQLVFTTHDTSVLDTNVLRRDQIWLCAKRKSQATELIPLTDFRPRKTVENLEKGYLSGRYGALPNVVDTIATQVL